MDQKNYEFHIGSVGTQNFTTVVAPAKQPGVPVCPAPLAVTLFGRGASIDALVARLTADAGTGGTSAVRGLPGVGKTDLVRAVGCDPRVVGHFGGGVLYAELGPDAEPRAILSRWLAELDAPVPQSDDTRTLTAVVRAALGTRPALIILDDIWSSSVGAALVLRECATGACHILVSSRSPELADTLAGGSSHTTKLDVLDSDASVALLRSHAPQAVERDPAGARELGAALGGLPLALKLAAGLLRHDRRSATPCAALQATWHARLAELRGYERRAGLDAEQLSLEAIIGLSSAALPDDATRAAAAALVVFGATPLDWDWNAMAAVWDRDETSAAPLERALIESGLLDYDDSRGRYSLHQTVNAFLKPYFADVQYIGRHVVYHARLLQRLNLQLQDSNSEHATLALLDRAMPQIDRGQKLAAGTSASPWRTQQLIDYAFACDTYFNLRGMYREKIVWTLDALDAAQAAGRGEECAGLQNNLGIAYLALGRYAEALSALGAAERYFRSHSQERELTKVLQNIAHVFQRQGRYDEAIAYYTDAIERNDKIEEADDVSGALIHLASIYRVQAAFDAALGALDRALALRKARNDEHGIAAVLANIASVYLSQGRYDQAAPLLNDALATYRTFGDAPHTADTLHLLGEIHRYGDRPAEAIDAYHQSFDLYHRIGDDAGLAATLASMGTMYRQLGLLDTAIDAQRHSLALFEHIGGMHNVAQVSWNLGLALAQLGDLPAALACIKRSVTVLETIDAASDDLPVRRSVMAQMQADLDAAL